MTEHRLGISLLLLVALLGSHPTRANEALDQKPITNFLSENCSKCHDAKRKKAGIDVAEYQDFRIENSTRWQDLLDQIQRGEMPPKGARQPSADARREFVAQVRARLDRAYADAGSRDFRFTRLTNQQIAWSLRDILGIDRDYSRDLVQDPVGKHGESLQSTLELTGGHMEAFLVALQKAVEEAVPDLDQPPKPYRLHGSDWEKQHYLNRNDLAFSKSLHFRRYRGERWLGDAFQIPLPPNHFFRIYLDDNRSEGQFRARITLRNEAPQNGGPLAKHEMTVFLDRGFKSSMHAVDSFTVEARPGRQVFEVFGNVMDFPGVNPVPVPKGINPYGTEAHFHYRFLSLQNCSPLKSPADKPVSNTDWVIHGDGHLVRADDQWIDAWGEEFGKENWLRRSHAGADHGTRGKPAVYKEVMKGTSHVVIERIEFDLPWQWPPKSVQPFLKDGKLTHATIAAGVKKIAERAWRRPLTPNESRELDSFIARKLAKTPKKTDALRDLLAAVLADSRFLFYSDMEKTARLQNHELVSRLAGFLWRSTPDDALMALAGKDSPIADAELSQQVDRMIADPRSERLVADFTSGWLAFQKLDQIAIDPNYYGWWNPHFKHYMKLESVAFLSTLLHENLSCLNILSSEFVVANDMTAKYYGIPKPESGHRYSRVPAPAHRGGVLTQPAFLLAHSTGDDSHVVQRGIWLRGRLLGDPPRDPPPGTPPLADLSVGAGDRLSVKDRLAAHGKETCYDCHKNIDPWGIALEAFDATGKYREKILRIPADEKKRLMLPVVQQTEIRHQSLSGIDDLKHFLKTSCADEFARGFSSSMLSFALGRPLNYKEGKSLDTVTGQFRKSDYRMVALLKAIVTLPEFKHPNSHTP